MSIPLPNLDNRTFDQLVTEMVTSIPKYSRIWTNFNPSDPGITLLELLAYLAEAQIYRANQIPYESYCSFLKLVVGSAPLGPNPDKAHQRIHTFLFDITTGKIKPDIMTIKAEVQNFMDSRYRAITTEDFCALALESDSRVKRVEMFTRPDGVDLILITDKSELADYKEIVAKVRTSLKPRLLVGTPMTVAMAEYTPVKLRGTICFESFAAIKPQAVLAKAQKAVIDYCDPITGGPEKTGWPYNRALTVYELFHCIEPIDGVKYVNEISALSGSEWKTFSTIPICGLVDCIGVELTAGE